MSLEIVWNTIKATFIVIFLLSPPQVFWTTVPTAWQRNGAPYDCTLMTAILDLSVVEMNFWVRRTVNKATFNQNSQKYLKIFNENYVFQISTLGLKFKHQWRLFRTWTGTNAPFNPWGISDKGQLQKCFLQVDNMWKHLHLPRVKGYGIDNKFHSSMLLSSWDIAQTKNVK